MLHTYVEKFDEMSKRFSGGKLNKALLPLLPVTESQFVRVDSIVFYFCRKKVTTSTTEGSRAGTASYPTEAIPLSQPHFSLCPTQSTQRPPRPTASAPPAQILAAPRGAPWCPSSHEVCLLAPAAMGAQQSVNAGKGHCSFLLIFLFVAIVARVGNLLASLICSWKCRSQGGYASRPHPYAVRGAAAAAPKVLGTLPVREPSNCCVLSLLVFPWV